VLILISLAMFGNYYIYDSISPLADVLKAQLGYSGSEIGLLNAIYSFPNIIMGLIGRIFSSLGFFGFVFAFLLRRREAGLYAHSFEAITTRAV
jgi:hypothetical protein